MDHSEQKQLVLLSAHDQTIMAALSYLRIRDWPYPQLGATLVFELRRLDDGEFVIQVGQSHSPRRNLPQLPVNHTFTIGRRRVCHPGGPITLPP